MSRTLRVGFNIIVSDGFEEAVREYYGYEGSEELDNEDMVMFVESNIRAAESRCEAFEVEGGDTDGWFVQCVSE